MPGGKMGTRIAVMATVFVVMVAQSTVALKVLTPRMVGRHWPSGYAGGSTVEEGFSASAAKAMHRLFDRRQTTKYTLEDWYADYAAVYYIFPRWTKVKKYRIAVGAGGDPKMYPRSWTLYGSKKVHRGHYRSGLNRNRDGFLRKGHEPVKLHEVQNYEFTGKSTPVFELTRKGNFGLYYLEFTEDGTPSDSKVRVTLAEIRLLGDLNQFDHPDFPGGVYPCEQTLDMLNKDHTNRGSCGPSGCAWANSSFGQQWAIGNAFHYDNGKTWINGSDEPVAIVRYRFHKAKTVYMFSFTGYLPFSHFEFQGHFCRNGSCDESGWVTLRTVTNHFTEGWWSSPSPDAWDGYTIYIVPEPKPYRAYRFLFTTEFTSVRLASVSFMGCRSRCGGANCAD